MKIIIGLALMVILMLPILANSASSESGNQVWLIKTKRGIDISCPYGFQYEDGTVRSCTKVNESTFNVVLSYNDLYVEEEFFNEKDLLKEAILAVKILPDVKIIEKKTFSWFGKITVDIKYEKDNLKGLQRMIMFNDGTMIVMHYVSKYYNHDVADKTLSSNIKILEPNQVAELEKIQEEYALKAQETANKKAAEAYKRKIDLEQKAAETKKKAEEKKKADEIKRKADEVTKKAEKEKRDAENQAQRIEKNLITYGEQIRDFEIRMSEIQKNPTSSKVIQELRLLEDDLSILKSKYEKFNNEKSVSAEGEVRNLKAAFTVKLTGLEKKQVGNNAQIKSEGTKAKSVTKNLSTERSQYSTKQIIRMDIICDLPRITARIFDETGQPISGAFVSLYVGGMRDYELALLAKTRSDQNGEWVLNLGQYYDAMDYNIVIKKTGFTELNYFCRE